MKKVFILLLSFGVSAAVFAQRNDHSYGTFNQPPVAHNDRDFRDEHRTDGYGFDARREHDDQIARINHAYDDRIAAVQYNRWMRPREKAREIRRLENERNERLRECEGSFSKSYDRRDAPYAHENKHNW